MILFGRSLRTPEICISWAGGYLASYSANEHPCGKKPLDRAAYFMAEFSVQLQAQGAYFLETMGYAITLVYSFRHHFPFSTYGENLFLTVQIVLITHLIIYFAPTYPPHRWNISELWSLLFSWPLQESHLAQYRWIHWLSFKSRRFRCLCSLNSSRCSRISGRSRLVNLCHCCQPDRWLSRTALYDRYRDWRFTRFSRICCYTSP